jgi:chromosomal replication initiation ATPase DnaA
MTYQRAVGYSDAGWRIYRAGAAYQRRQREQAEEALRRAQERETALLTQIAEEQARIAAAALEERLAELQRQSAELAEQAAIEANRPRVKTIIQAACVHFGLTRADLLSRRRTPRVARPRQVVMFLAKELTPASLPEIGRRMGDLDHTTILHGIRKIASLIEAGDPIAADVKAIRKSLTGSEEPGA